MNNEKNKNKVIVILCLLLSLIATLYFIILSKSIADYRFFVGDRLKFNSFFTSFLSLFIYEK